MNLGVVDAGEVTGAGWLVLLWVEGEGVGVDTRVGVAAVVVEWLELVEELAKLLLEAILAVENELELVKRTNLQTTLLSTRGDRGTLLGPCVKSKCSSTNKWRVWCTKRGEGHTGDVGGENLWRTELGGAGNGRGVGDHKGRHGHVDVGNVGGEIPEGIESRGWEGGVLVDPGELLDWVVERETDSCGLGLADSSWNGVTAGVLNLLDEILVTLLREAAALLSVEEHIVGPDGWLGSAEVVLVVGGTVNVETDLVVLKGDEWEVKTRVAVEEEDEWKVYDTLRRGSLVARLWVGQGGHLVILNLVVIGEVQLSVYTPPGLEVLVDALATDGELNGGESALGDPAGVGDGVVGGEEHISGGWGELSIHVTDEVTVASDGDGNTLIVTSGTVDGLWDHLHSEVGVALVDGLEECNFRIACEVDILSTIQMFLTSKL